jgi:hypothetical protein
MNTEARRKNKLLVSAAIIVIPVIAALAALAAINTYGDLNPGKMAVVTSSTGEVWQLPLNRDSRTQITTPLGTNIIVVQNGEVFVESADCPGSDCVEHQPVSAAGQTIICLPHKLVVEVRGEDNGSALGDVNAAGGNGFGSESESGENSDSDSGTTNTNTSAQEIDTVVK